MTGLMSPKVLAVAFGVVILILTSFPPAEARNGRNAAAAVGAVGGFALGAAIAAGAAQAGPPPPSVYYAAPPPPVVYEYDEPRCRIVTRTYDDGYRRRRERTEICD